jgi:hypothetical protein
MFMQGLTKVGLFYYFLKGGRGDEDEKEQRKIKKTVDLAAGEVV